MRRVEQVKIFTGSDATDVEKEYNEWYIETIEARAEVPVLDNVPFQIYDRVFTIRNYDGEETYALAIFYEYMQLLPEEQGKDRGAGAGLASAFPSERRKRARAGKR